MDVTVSDVSQGYGSATVLDKVSMTLRPGVNALVGPNGAGKSTLLRTSATVMPPRTGVIRINGTTVDSERSARLVRDDIGYLPQAFGFDPRMRVADFVTYAAWLRGVPAADRQRSVDQALETADLASQRRTRMRALSGGMRQRAGIAWATVGRPGLVLLDEPTVGLDPRQQLHFRKSNGVVDPAAVRTNLVPLVLTNAPLSGPAFGAVAREQGPVPGPRFGRLVTHLDVDTARQSLYSMTYNYWGNHEGYYRLGPPRQPRKRVRRHRERR